MNVPISVPATAIYHLPPPYANQRGKKKPLVTIEDYKGPFVAARLMSPLLCRLSYTATVWYLLNIRDNILSEWR